MPLAHTNVVDTVYPWHCVMALKKCQFVNLVDKALYVMHELKLGMKLNTFPAMSLLAGSLVSCLFMFLAHLLLKTQYFS